MANAAGEREEYLYGMNVVRLARRCILDSMVSSWDAEIISRGTRFMEASGSRAEKAVRTGRRRLGSNGTVSMLRSNSRRASGRSSGEESGARRRLASGESKGEGLAGAGYSGMDIERGGKKSGELRLTSCNSACRRLE